MLPRKPDERIINTSVPLFWMGKRKGVGTALVVVQGLERSIVRKNELHVSFIKLQRLHGGATGFIVTGMLP